VLFRSPDTALIRALRRQLASPLPVIVRLPAARDAADLAGHSARVAGANLLLAHDAGAREIAQAVAHATGVSLPDAGSRVQRQAALIDAWQQQLELIALPDHAAATVVAARRVLESLLALREDERGAEAALALTAIAGGPVPLGRWAGWYHPAHETFAGEAELSQRRQRTMPMCLLFDAGGQRYGLPLDAEVAPGCWWTDGSPQVPAGEPVASLPLVRLLGSSGFRRLLCTDRATVLLRRLEGDRTVERGLRVDDVLGIESLEVDSCPTFARLASGCQAVAVDRDGEPVLVLDGERLWRLLHAAQTPVIR
jgi:hypothetical protein